MDETESIKLGPIVVLKWNCDYQFEPNKATNKAYSAARDDYKAFPQLCYGKKSSGSLFWPGITHYFTLAAQLQLGPTIRELCHRLGPLTTVDSTMPKRVGRVKTLCSKRFPLEPNDSIYVELMKLNHFVEHVLPHINVDFVLISGQSEPFGAHET